MKRTFDTLITVMAAHAGDATIDIPALHRNRNITQISTQETRTQVNLCRPSLSCYCQPTLSHPGQIKNIIYGISGKKVRNTISQIDSKHILWHVVLVWIVNKRVLVVIWGTHVIMLTVGIMTDQGTVVAVTHTIEHRPERSWGKETETDNHESGVQIVRQSH